MGTFGFTGPSDQPLARLGDRQRCFNLAPQAIEAPNGKAAAVLIGTPGLTPWLSNGGVSRAAFYQDGRAVAVQGTTFQEMFSNATTIDRGTVADDASHSIASICTNGSAGNQALIIASGQGYIFNTSTNAFTGPLGGGFPAGIAVMGCFSDGFFIVLDQTGTIHLSALEDGTSWPGTAVAQKSTTSDKTVAIAVNQDLLWLFGTKTTQPWFNAGLPVFPFTPVQSALIEQGILAANSICLLDNTIFWLGGDVRGNAVMWRADGYLPRRVSTQGPETAWQGVLSNANALGDTECFGYQEYGHNYLVVSSPTANMTWVLDTTSGFWHERGTNNVLNADCSISGNLWLPRTHLAAPPGTLAVFPHIVGSRVDGQLYQMSSLLYNDAGVKTLRVRISPHLAHENQWVNHNQFILDVEPDQAAGGQAKTIQLQWSNDGGFTWSNSHFATVPPIGGVGTDKNNPPRAIWRSLGRARDRVYCAATTDQTKVAWTDAYLRTMAGWGN